MPIFIDLKIRDVVFRDGFDWDPTSALTPEAFAAAVCQDLKLPAPFQLAISVSIREQLLEVLETSLWCGVMWCVEGGGGIRVRCLDVR